MDFDADMDGPDSGWDEGPPPPFSRRQNNKFQRYNDAYGDYVGGYGPGGGYGPPRNFGPNRSFGPPPPHFGPPEPPPFFMMGRGFGPDGPPMNRRFQNDKPTRFLLRCGVPKENLKNLPRDVLNQMEPNYCGVCGHQFDSMAMSRVHYVSKNHWKNVKKWTAQRTELGGCSPNEIPFKARDLYCELCDVHITSKSHSDSHYAGKPHRAIVDGRKNPRNPILLQNGMQQRVQQLIRREKKFYKDVVDEAEVTKEKVPPVTEFYCDICKTSMSSSDQMTNHLNGKRHLSREKQHILKVMRGEVDEKEAPAEDGENAVEKKGDDGTDANGGEATDKAAADISEWGNDEAGGSWDEPLAASEY